MEHQFICFGEILWDVLPTGKVLGGAPLNVAYHLNQLGIPAKMVSQVGDDADGQEIQQALHELSLSDDYLFVHPGLPTSQVTVQIDTKGIAQYTIHEPVAWDAIDPTQLPDIQPTWLIYGSLAARQKVTREALLALKERSQFTVFDINIRPPFFSMVWAERLMTDVTLCKLNEDELAYLASLYQIQGEPVDQVTELAKRFHWKMAIVTCGGEGAYVWTPTEWLFGPAIEVSVADTVGSGDAFLAGFLSEYIKGNSLKSALAKGLYAGSYIAQKKGAIHAFE